MCVPRRSHPVFPLGKSWCSDWALGFPDYNNNGSRLRLAPNLLRTTAPESFNNVLRIGASA
eukprot:8388455-Pyramimonas_sp.AAC.1